MKITTVQYFVTLAQCSSISEAAQRLYIAQPTLTKALQQFEQEIGVKLFDRGREGIALTSAGKQILPQAKLMLEYYHQWLDLGRQTSLQSIDVYVGRSFSDMILPNILVKFRQRHPNLPVNYIVRRNPGAFLSASTERPVIALFACDPKDVQVYSKLQGNGPAVLSHGESQCVVSRYSPLAHRRSVTLPDLKDLLLVLPGSSWNEEEEYSNETSVVSRIFSAFPNQATIHVESAANVIRQVAENPQTYTIAHHPMLMRYKEIQSGELIHLPFSDVRQEVSLCLFCSKQAYNRHPVVAELVSDIQHGFESFFRELE